MNKVVIFFLLFIIYSFLGWLMEVSLIFISKKKIVNRGFLLGPICPIYGYGVLGILFLIGNATTDILSVFLKSILICSLLEYFTSYIMEKMFKARWWDYSNKKFNINGRICLETMLPFGILGTFIVYILNPLVLGIVKMIPSIIRNILAIILFISYIIDNIISFKVMNSIRGEINTQKTDNTEVIKKRVTKWLEKNSILYRRLNKAYPKFEIAKKSRRKI